MPRLDTPRPKVPAGAVGAGRHLVRGVYPTASPGGWRLLGRTDAPLWDADRDAAGAAGAGHPGQVRAGMSTSLLIEDGRRPGHGRRTAAGPVSPTSACRGPVRWTDRPRELANRLVGNAPDAAVLEVTLGGFVAASRPGRCGSPSPGPAAPHGRRPGAAHGEAVWVPRGGAVAVGPAERGARPTSRSPAGSRSSRCSAPASTDTLAWVGPPRVADGAELPVGPAAGAPGRVRRPAAAAPGPLRVDPGPARRLVRGRRARPALRRDVRRTPESNRVGLRLDGPPLPRGSATASWPSEGMVLGAVQVPPDGQPVVFLADHPPTGGYPVLAVVHPDDLWQCAQLRPGGRGCGFDGLA